MGPITPQHHRIIAAFGVTALTIIMLGVFGLTRMGAVNDRVRTIATDSLPGLATSVQIEVLAYQNLGLLEDHIVFSKDKLRQQQIEGEIQRNIAAEEALIKRYGAAAMTDVERGLSVKMVQLRASFLVAFRKALDESSGGDDEEVLCLFDIPLNRLVLAPLPYRDRTFVQVKNPCQCLLRQSATCPTF